MNSIVEKIWEYGAILVSTDEGFELASGHKSPIYIDCRSLISYPDVMDLIADEAAKIVKETGTEILAGGETAGIPYATWISARTKVPMTYIRRRPKGYGRTSQIEGSMDAGKKVLLVEDLITSGYSKDSFVEGIRNSGATVEHCLVVFDREQGGRKRLKNLGIELHSLATLSETLEYGLKNNELTQEDYKKIQKYLKADSE
ncbi:MAG: orotate phosphoribosyltransferase [Euryarchaeota archaeon]|jgi:orotate phosphoribosyltransferase|nr:orotate phosphoribosyltransferase [Euryarchaeota archaeon]HIK01378.1 orotate phosphoribosyltransferase [Candidatus Undinarchaeales archaeon ERR594346 U_76725]|tara:strand:- start:10153 stop:10755 length:603 start_codon:yes stop_codon:yes gene_type:complete